MPGKVRVKIIAGRNLPVMDRGSDTTDAYVEIKLANTTYKTDVYRKSLNPQWNSDFYRFELDDAELQDEPLQIRLMDYDTYSANDAIGKVNICLNPLLLPSFDMTGQVIRTGKGAVMSGWIPVFDTCKGIRGEVNLIVKVDLFSDVNKFRQSSCGVQFFHSSIIPYGYVAQAIHGFVEELVVNDDPEYQWIDKIRTPRASNEARQVVFLKLSAQVQRKIGLKAIDLGANAVIGYAQCFDLEGDVGVVARGTGTAVTLVKINESMLQPTADAALLEESNVDCVGSPKTIGHIRAESTGGKMAHSPSKGMVSGSQSASVASTSKEPIFRRSSDSDLSVTPKGNSLSTTTERPERVETILKTPFHHDNLDMLEYPFLTMSTYPQGFILHLGATVCSRSVKLLERVPNPDEPETRDSWWKELRMEVRSHARALNCNVILGYTEVTTISDDVCVLSASGTAAVINPKYTTDIATSGRLLVASVGSAPKDINQSVSDVEKDFRRVAVTKDIAQSLPINDKALSTPTTITDVEHETELVSLKINKETGCTLCHIPYRNSATFNMQAKKCASCNIGDVPDVLMITIELPDSVQITGRGCFVQAQVCRTKKDLKSESNAKEISDAIPFLEYEIHRLLVNKIKSKGMNALFGMKATIAIGEKVIALIATGTAVYLPSLPAPSPPKIIAGNSWSNSDKIRDLQKSLRDTFDRNREIYQLKSSEELELGSRNATSDEMYLKDIEPSEIDLTNGNKDACVLEVDDIEDLEIIALLMEPSPPDGFHIVNTQTVPGLHDLEVIRNLQMFVQVYRAKLGLNQQASNFPKHFQRLIHTIYFKIRSMIPCAICDFRFRLDFPESEEIQILVTGMALGLGEPSRLTKYKRKVAAHPQTKESKRIADDELIFNIEDAEQPEPLTQSLTFPSSSKTLTHTGSLKLQRSPNRSRFNSVRAAKHVPLRERFGVDLTPLCYVPGGKIDKYLGNLDFFFIRESTSVKENGGISGFVHSFITEVLAIVRANITALGGNAMVSFYMTELILVDNPHKNHGQCLISVGGDVVFVSYFSDE
ncbi:C2 domain-containing protein 5 isoform X2 [Bradysia coprophila]|uniref:C2 domain-containing protein 5 isoform X2 n=1 Tax=Bradysia coprophila TaxID=38358 RepID=UPI00187DC36D|nr:C2 domain-containing protein 5 isoform X2 [Bradysia coprophila]